MSPLRRLPSRRAVLVAASLLAGCSVPVVKPPPVPPPVTPAPAPAGAPPAPATTGGWAWSAEMDAVQSRLRSALRGTPVDLSQTTDQRLWLSVPADQAFAAGRPALTPAAGGWLDQLAVALRQAPRATLQIVGPLEARGGPTLGVDRAASARDWLAMRGIAPTRVSVSAQAPKPRGGTPEPRLEILIGDRGR